MSDYRVSANVDLTSTWIESDSATHQATRKDVSVTVKDGLATRDEYINLEMFAKGDDTVLNLWKFEDLDEVEALAELMLDRVEEVRSDKQVGLYDE